MKVALIQNQVGIDGRSRVIGEIVVALNELGITPDVFTLSTATRVRGWREVLMEGRPMRFGLPRTWRVPVIRGYVYQTVAHNWLLRNVLSRYDLVVNGNDFVGFVPTSVRRIHYFHFPIRAAFAVMSRYGRRVARLATSPARLVAERFDGEILGSDVVFANSCFTRERVRELWPSARCEVLYPPVDAPAAMRARERDIDVVTLGNIAPEKHQLEQVKLAESMPGRRFALVGAVNSPVYRRRLERVIRSRRLTNVTLVLDASSRVVSEHLWRARVLLHMKESEHFGIAVAQAIAHGCVPIVHDSGGQVEIVTDPALRFQSSADIPRILDDVLSGRLPEPDRARQMCARLAEFAPERFRERIKAAVLSDAPQHRAGRARA
jgi:glycosyltransferase involved in cell wall biosynthesis